MKLSEVQTFALNRVKADARLAAFGDPVLYSPFRSEDDSRAMIDAALRAKGVCIEIGSVEADWQKEQPNPRFTKLDAAFTVWIAESITVAHELREMELVTAVAEAVQVRVSVQEQNARCTSYAAALHELGYVLHVLSFSVPCTL